MNRRYVRSPSQRTDRGIGPIPNRIQAPTPQSLLCSFGKVIQPFCAVLAFQVGAREIVAGRFGVQVVTPLRVTGGEKLFILGLRPWKILEPRGAILKRCSFAGPDAIDPVGKEQSSVR